MWLPKDERKLLSYYYREINKVETEQRFEIRDLIKALGKKEQSGQSKTKSEIILNTYNTLENVNNLLSQRGLITWKNLDPTSISVLQELPKTSEALSWPENTNVNLHIILTIEGYNLGKKYNSKIGTLGIWFTEYLWFLVVLSVVIGIIGVLTTIIIAIIKD